MGCENLDGLKEESKEEELRNWASYRGQTLSRTGEYKIWHNLNPADQLIILITSFLMYMVVTVRGMMYYREALKLQAFLDVAEDEGLYSESLMQISL